MNPLRCLSSVLVLLLLSSPGSAWWEDGHIIVSRIAESRLSKDAQAAIKDLLGDNAEGERAISDSRICNWADLIRSSGALNRKYPKNDTWHYINIEIQVTKEDFKLPNDNNHVVGAIERFKKVLKDPKAEKQDLKEALLFLVHFIGDMHQPLHTGNRADDLGGNLQPIKSVLGKVENRLNLHKVWDGYILQAERGELTNDDFAKRLTEQIKKEEAAKWCQGEVADWVWESHTIVVELVYKFSDGKNLPNRSDPAVELTSENYVKANQPIVREQLKKGGVRLAKVLNDCFESKK
jgi:nuclease S1